MDVHATTMNAKKFIAKELENFIISDDALD
jgi:hypothetical protein